MKQDIGIEARARTRRRKRQLKTALLLACLGAGLVLIGARPDPKRLWQYIRGANAARFNYTSKRALERLKNAGLVVFIEENGKWCARTTHKGRIFLYSKGLLGFMNLRQKGKWDRRWRVIVFDIPEKRRKTRDRLRKFMEGFGFKRLQDSVWVYPYDCEEVLALLKAELRIGAAVLYMIVEEIENDRHLREHFGLPLS